VTDYVVAEKTSVVHIYRRLCNVCGSAAVDGSTVGRWVKRITASETGKQSFVTNLAQAVLFELSVLKCRRVVMPSFAWIVASQLDNWHSFILSISKESNSHIIRDLGSWKVCTTWVPRILTVEHKTERKVISSGLARFEIEGKTFLSRNVTASKTRVRNFEPETKIQSMK